MKPRRFAIFGTGFWSRYQLAGWRELTGVQCVALYNRTRAKAEALGNEFGIGNVYDDPEALFENEELDFVDIITDVDTHRPFVELAAKHRLPVICQKPMAPDLEGARSMAAVCRQAGVPLLIHENWRWQTAIRALAAELNSGVIGEVFRARIDYGNSFPVFENQPFLKELEQFILTDIGTHILDAARFLFGEASRLYCQTFRVHQDIRGEDVATVMMELKSGATLTCNMSYASCVEHDRFPETFAFIEGTSGSLKLSPDFWIRTTTARGTVSRRHVPPFYAWADPRYAAVHSSIVDCNRNLLDALTGTGKAETTAEDNLKTLELVFAAYQSAAEKRAIELGG